MGDDWDELQKLHITQFKTLYEFKCLKHRSIVGSVIGGTLGSLLVTGLNYVLTNRARKNSIQPQVDEFVEETKKELLNYPVVAEEKQAELALVDSSNITDFINDTYCDSFYVYYTGPWDKFVFYRDLVPRPVAESFCQDFRNGKFDYIANTIDSLYESVFYSFEDSLKDMIPFCIGAFACMGVYYAFKLHKFKNKVEEVNTEVFKMEDKLFWNR